MGVKVVVATIGQWADGGAWDYSGAHGQMGVHVQRRRTPAGWFVYLVAHATISDLQARIATPRVQGSISLLSGRNLLFQLFFIYFLLFSHRTRK